VLERLDQSLAQVERDGIVKGPWKKARAWIQTTLAELWRERGTFPGIPAVLAFLGVDQPEVIYRTIFRPLERQGKDPRELLFGLLSGQQQPPKALKLEFAAAAVEWNDLRERTRDLLRFLTGKSRTHVECAAALGGASAEPGRCCHALRRPVRG
jgi:hypothetical protein